MWSPICFKFLEFWGADLEADLQTDLRADLGADFEADLGAELASDKKSQIYLEVLEFRGRPPTGTTWYDLL